MRLTTLVSIFLAFTIWSFSIVFSLGFGNLFDLVVRERWAAQLFVDLTISLTVAWTWLVPDAREHKIPAWPYILATAALGSIAVLAYLIHRETQAALRPPVRTSTANSQSQSATP